MSNRGKFLQMLFSGPGLWGVVLAAIASFVFVEGSSGEPGHFVIERAFVDR